MGAALGDRTRGAGLFGAANQPRGIDKARQPKWQPARLEDVGEDLIESYFRAPDSGDMTFV